MANDKLYIFDDENVRINVYEEAQSELQLINDNPSIEIVRIYEPGPQGPRGNDGGSYIAPSGIVSSSQQIDSDISGSFVSASNLLSERISTIESKTLFSGSSQVIYSQLSGIPSDLVSGSDQLSASFDSKYERKGTGLVSSSGQIQSEISGSFISASNSLSSRINIFENKTLISASAQVNFESISGSFSTSSFLQNLFTASFNSYTSSNDVRVGRLEQVTSSFVTNVATSSLLNNSYSASTDLKIGRLESFTSSYAIKTEITGAFAAISSSLLNRIEAFENKSLISGSEQLTSSFDARYERQGIGILSSSNGFVSSSSQIDYNSIQNQPTTIPSASYALTASYVSGSANSSLSSSYSVTSSYSNFAVSASYVPGSTLPSGLLSSSAQIQNDISGSFISISSSLSSRIYSLEQATSSFAAKNEISGAFSIQSSSLSNRISTFESKTVFSGSSQVDYNSIQNIPSGIISSSNGLISGSDQLSGSYDLRYERKGTGLLSSSQQINSGSFSGSFSGNGGNLTGIISSSYALSASYAPAQDSVSSSYALTASYAMNGGGSNIQTIGVRIVTQDSFIIEGSKGFKHIGYNSNITKVRGIANTTGSINLNIKRNNSLLGNYQLSNQTGSIDSTLSGWTTTLNVNDLIEFSVSQSSTYITDLTFFMDLQSI